MLGDQRSMAEQREAGLGALGLHRGFQADLLDCWGGVHVLKEIMDVICHLTHLALEEEP